MAQENSPVSLAIPIPEACPQCESPWEENACPRCGLTRDDIIGLLERGCSLYEAARAAAMTGDFVAARLHLRTLQQSGIPSLLTHPAVRRLSDLCAEPMTEPPVSPAPSTPVEPATTPSWMVPFLIGGGALGVAAFFLAALALVFSVAAFVLALMVFFRSS